jgi:alanine racemase
MTESSKRAWATIDLRALKKNLSRVSVYCPESKIIPVIKANAYGHGLEQVATTLVESHTNIAALAVATIDEASQLTALKLKTPVLLLPGFSNRQEMALCFKHAIEPVLHCTQQLELLNDYQPTEAGTGVARIWLKLNSGMNRLGLSPEQAVVAYSALHKLPETEVVLMSHLACSDDPQEQLSVDFTRQQQAQFEAVRETLSRISTEPLGASLVASAGIVNLPASHYQFVRPGIMLYGGSPLLNQSSEEIGLLPVMTLSARLIVINEVKAGASIGYGATYQCEHDTRVGVVAIGYGDGYPRSAVNGTPVLIKTVSGEHRTTLIGRVSMDMITVDLTGMDDVQPGDEVVLWGKGLPADEVAKSAGTISYELFCKVTNRVVFEYIR